MRRFTAVLAITLASAMFVAGCGSDGKSSAGSADASSAGSGKTVKVEADDFAFKPTDIELDPGSATLEVQNAGQVEHNITVEGLDVNKDLEAGETTKVAVDAKAGTYEFHCKYHPTQMKGTITVK